MPRSVYVRVSGDEWSFIRQVARDHHSMLNACPRAKRAEMLRRLVRREDISESVSHPLPLSVFARALGVLGMI